MAVADLVDTLHLELAIGSQADFRTAIALDHGMDYFVSAGRPDLFLAAYQDSLVVSFAAAVAVVAREAIAAAQEVHRVRDWVVRHSQEEAAAQMEVRTDQAVAVVLLHCLEEEVLVPSDFLDYRDNLD